jgi:hypothetical protein
MGTSNYTTVYVFLTLAVSEVDELIDGFEPSSPLLLFVSKKLNKLILNAKN